MGQLDEFGDVCPRRLAMLAKLHANKNRSGAVLGGYGTAMQQGLVAKHQISSRSIIETAVPQPSVT